MPPTRDELALQYLDQLPYTPYPVQEEALHTGSIAYHTTLLIALTEQKFHEMQRGARTSLGGNGTLHFLELVSGELNV